MDILFVPETAFRCTGLRGELCTQGIHGDFVTGVFFTVVETEKYFPRIYMVEIVIGFLVSVNDAILVDDGIGIIFDISIERSYCFGIFFFSFIMVIHIEE